MSPVIIATIEPIPGIAIQAKIADTILTIARELVGAVDTVSGSDCRTGDALDIEKGSGAEYVDLCSVDADDGDDISEIRVVGTPALVSASSETRAPHTGQKVELSGKNVPHVKHFIWNIPCTVMMEAE
ncbi:MAG: hypothetical protein AAGF95_22105 [Chloroflexota bacterium]